MPARPLTEIPHPGPWRTFSCGLENTAFGAGWLGPELGNAHLAASVPGWLPFQNRFSSSEDYRSLFWTVRIRA